MPSPFPGMNPYFEQPGIWRGFHTLLIGQVTFALSPQAGPRYFVNVEQSVYIERGEEGRELLGVADVAVADGGSGRVAEGDAGVATATTPVKGSVRVGALKRYHRWLTVRDGGTQEVVTVIELLSPSNKRGEDRGQYLRKRRRILRSAAHLVEIDLLRGGPRMPVAGVPASDYRATVSRQPQRPDVDVWPIALRQPLPVIPIPLRTGEAELRLDLKAAIDAVYDGASYHHRLYLNPPDPPLSAPDAEWARQFLPPG
jgi:hypothetical protein